MRNKVGSQSIVKKKQKLHKIRPPRIVVPLTVPSRSHVVARPSVATWSTPDRGAVHARLSRVRGRGLRVATEHAALQHGGPTRHGRGPQRRRLFTGPCHSHPSADGAQQPTSGAGPTAGRPTSRPAAVGSRRSCRRVVDTVRALLAGRGASAATSRCRGRRYVVRRHRTSAETSD